MYTWGNASTFVQKRATMLKQYFSHVTATLRSCWQLLCCLCANILLVFAFSSNEAVRKEISLEISAGRF